MAIPATPPSTLAAQRSVSRTSSLIASLVALPVQRPSPGEINSHDGVTDGRGQFWKLPSSRARALLPSRSTSSPVNVPDAVQNRSEFQPPPRVPIGPVKRGPSCAVTVNDPEQPPQFSEFPVLRSRNTVVPVARQWPVSDGKSCASTPGDVKIAGAWLIDDGPVGVALTPLQAQESEAVRMKQTTELAGRTLRIVQRAYQRLSARAPLSAD